MNRWKIIGDQLPRIPLILRYPQRSGSAAHGQAITAFVHIKCVSKNDVVCVVLRQAVAKDIKSVAAVSRSCHHKPTIDRNAFLVVDAGHKPGCIWVSGMHGYRESEGRGLYVTDFVPGICPVGRTKHAVMMLDPERVRLVAAIVESYEPPTNRAKCPSSGRISLVMARRTAAGEPGMEKISVCPRTPATARESMAADPISS